MQENVAGLLRHGINADELDNIEDLDGSDAEEDEMVDKIEKAIIRLIIRVSLDLGYVILSFLCATGTVC